MGTLTEVDRMVIDIIGKESPVLRGLGVAESFENSPSQAPQISVLSENDDCDNATKVAPIKENQTITSKEGSIR